MQNQYIRTNHINLHAVVAGPEDGPLILLLHGFPEFWYSWRKQIDVLADSGFRVIAPDQRGYHLSDKPKGLASYNWYELTADVVGVIEASGRSKAILIGHDWGGAVGWYVAAQYPASVERLIILNAPHPKVLRRHLRKSFSQKKKSWYMFFFQIPWLPEKLMKVGNWLLLRRSLIKTSRVGTFDKEDIRKYVEAWSVPNSIPCMVNWYRAMMRNKRRMTNPRITVPTLLIWGTQDAFLGAEMAKDSIEMCDNGSLAWIEGASHWVQQEEPLRVNDLILNFLRVYRRL